MVKWIESNGGVQWLGATPTAIPDTTKLAAEENRLGKQLDTQDKVLILSLFLSLATFAWSIFEWKSKK